VPSDLAGGTGEASVDEVCEGNNRQRRSDHRAPPFRSASYINSHVTAQMWILVFTLEVGFSGIHMSFVSGVGVILSSIFCHNITSSVMLLWLVFRFE
jgi:hypothetical protein